MAATTTLPQSNQMIVTLEPGVMTSDIKKALKLIRGVASVRVANISDDKTITASVKRSISKARKEFASGETISCSTPEEMQHYFDNL